MSKLIRYIIGVYAAGALVTAGIFGTFATYEPSAKNVRDAAYNTILWPLSWWNLAVRGEWTYMFGLFLFGVLKIAPFVLLVAGGAWGVRFILRRNSRLSKP